MPTPTEYMTLVANRFRIVGCIVLQTIVTAMYTTIPKMHAADVLQLLHANAVKIVIAQTIMIGWVRLNVRIKNVNSSSTKVARTPNANIFLFMGEQLKIRYIVY
jgi:hypothetical protein